MRRLCLLLLCCLSALAFGADWELVRSDSERDIQVFARPMEQGPYDRFYAVTHIKTRLSTAVAVLADIPAMPEWLARVSQARVMKRKEDREVWVYTVYKLPYPFKGRDTVIHSVLSQDPHTGVVTVESRTVPELLGKTGGYVRLQNLRSTWKFTPQANGMLKVELWGEGDPGGYIPSWLFNYNLPDEPVQTLRNLRRMVLRDKYQSRQLAYIREPHQPQP